MKCSICNKELLPNGTCPICGNETDRLKIVQQSEDSEGMDSAWVAGMEKARMIARIWSWLGLDIATIGAFLMLVLKKETLGFALGIVGMAIYGAQVVYAEIKHRCPSCKRRFRFGGRYRNQWKRLSSCPKCHKALYGHLADEESKYYTW